MASVLASTLGTDKPVGREGLSAGRMFLLYVVVLSAGFVYSQVFVFPNVPRAPYGDETVYLLNATRMLHGQVIYRDYDHFTLPGADVWYAAIFKVFGVHAWIPPAMLVVLASALAGLSFEISKRIMPASAAMLPGALFLALAFSGYLDATHWWYSTAALMAGLFVLMDGRSPRRLVLSGVFWGIAVCFTQCMIAGMAGVCVFLLWESTQSGQPWASGLRKQASFLAGALGTIFAFLSYFLVRAGPRSVFEHCVVFVIKYYPADRFNSWQAYMADYPSRRDWTKWPDLLAFLLVYLLIPLIYILFFVRFRREARLHPRSPWKELMLINLAGLFLFLGIAPSAGYTRMYAISLPAFVLVTWFLTFPGKIEKWLLRACWMILVTLGVARPLLAQTHFHPFLELPIGRAAVFDQSMYAKLRWLSEHTRPGEYFAGDSGPCFALGLQNPTRVPFLRPTDYTRPEEVDDFIHALEFQKVRYVSWYSGLDTELPNHDHLAPVRLFLREHYFVAKKFSNGDAILERRGAITSFTEPSQPHAGPPPSPNL